jgi:hypothetical protein
MFGICDFQKVRGVAQLARALRSGRRGRRFKSAHPDQKHYDDPVTSTSNKALRPLLSALFIVLTH